MNGTGLIKETVYNILQNPTRENFIEILSNGLGEQDNLDFKEQWVEPIKLAEIILGMANTGGGAIIVGVRESDDGTLEAVGLSELQDKEKIDGKVKKFLPDTIRFEIGDFDFKGEYYNKIKGELFQILLVYSEDVDLPYIWNKDSNGTEQGCIFYRRGTKTVKANSQEIKDMIEARIEAVYIEQSNLQLEEHLKQLSTLYKHIAPQTYSLFPFDKLLGNFSNTMNGGTTIAGMRNANYPEESYEEFIAKMIDRKKEKITRILDLK